MGWRREGKRTSGVKEAATGHQIVLLPTQDVQYKSRQQRLSSLRSVDKTKVLSSSGAACPMLATAEIALGAPLPWNGFPATPG